MRVRLWLCRVKNVVIEEILVNCSVGLWLITMCYLN